MRYTDGMVGARIQKDAVRCTPFVDKTVCLHLEDTPS